MELIGREEAASKGLTRFFTGKLCKRKHLAERYVTGGQCLECEKLRDIERRDYKIALKRKRYAEDPEVREKQRLRDKSYRERNGEVLRAKGKEKYIRTREVQIARSVANYKANKEARNASQNERLKNNPVKYICRILVQYTLKKIKQNKEARTHEILGYSGEEFKEHIEKQFREGMTWQNHGEWHLDHVKPVHLFIKEGVTDMKVINALSNLQPLWAAENLSKQGKYNGS